MTAPASPQAPPPGINVQLFIDFRGRLVGASRAFPGQPA
jgi:hypothetical protein